MGALVQAEPVSEALVQAEPVSEPQISAESFEEATSMWTPERQAEAEAGLDIFGHRAVTTKRTFYEQDTDADFTPTTGEEAAEPVATPSLEDDAWSPLPSPRSRKVKKAKNKPKKQAPATRRWR